MMLRPALLALATCWASVANAQAPCADLSGDGQVAVDDLLALLAAYGSSADGDITGDGVTNVDDLLSLLGSFGSACTLLDSGACTGSFSIASDNSYALYIQGQYQANVNGGRTNVDGCDASTNQFGDPYTGCNWQSVDLHEFAGIQGPLVIAVDALDAGGAGGWIGTAVVNGVEYPTNDRWRCWHGSEVGQSGGWSNVNSDWHGEALPVARLWGAPYPRVVALESG